MKVKPFLKWAGGKTQLLPKIAKNLPLSIDNYFEPFLGGGSVLFYILNNYDVKNVIVSDINEDLINTYNVVKNDVESLISILKDFKENHSFEFYYSLRGLESRITKKYNIILKDSGSYDNVTKAARFIYLNKTCFNGLYRVNSDNKFNVPMGRYKNPEIFDEFNLRNISELIQNVNFNVCSYSEILKLVKKGDFVYLDPPYDKLDDNSFTSYTKDDFTRDDQVLLKEFCNLLHNNKVKFLQSNSSTDFIKSIYNNFNIQEVDAKRMINSNGLNRGKIKEVFIKNY
jgi:DNA adenine methylase